MFIKNKELIQYIEDFDSSIIDKKICYKEGYIYILYFEQNNLQNSNLFRQNDYGNDPLFNNCNQKKIL